MQSILPCARRGRLIASMTLSVALAPCVVGAQTPSPWGTFPTPPVVPVATQDDAASLARLRSVLAWHDTLERDRRRTVSIVGGISGGIAIAAGVACSFSEREETQFAGFLTASMGAGTLLGIAIAPLIPSSFEPVREAMAEAGRARRSDAEVREATERVWRERVESAARTRTSGSTLMIILGGATMLAGGVMLAVDVRGSSTREVMRLGGASVFGFGTIIAVAGAALRFAPEPLEQSWEVYQRTAPHLSWGVSAVPGGAAAVVGGTF